MDIRFINRKDEIINGSGLSIKAMGSSLIGINAEQKIVEIERYESEEKAKEVLKKVGEIVKRGSWRGVKAVIIPLKEKEWEIY